MDLQMYITQISWFRCAIHKQEVTLKWVLNRLELPKAFISKNIIPCHMVMEALMLYPFLLVGNSFLVAVIKEGKVDVPVMNSGLFQNVKNWSSIFFFFFL